MNIEYTGENFSFSIEERIFQDELGAYQYVLLAIKTKEEELLAKLVPMGASSLFGEGVIEIINWLREEHNRKSMFKFFDFPPSGGTERGRNHYNSL